MLGHLPDVVSARVLHSQHVVLMGKLGVYLSESSDSTQAI